MSTPLETKAPTPGVYQLHVYKSAVDVYKKAPESEKTTEEWVNENIMSSNSNKHEIFPFKLFNEDNPVILNTIGGSPNGDDIIITEGYLAHQMNQAGQPHVILCDPQDMKKIQWRHVQSGQDSSGKRVYTSIINRPEKPNQSREEAESAPHTLFKQVARYAQIVPRGNGGDSNEERMNDSNEERMKAFNNTRMNDSNETPLSASYYGNCTSGDKNYLIGKTPDGNEFGAPKFLTKVLNSKKFEEARKNGALEVNVYSVDPDQNGQSSVLVFEVASEDSIIDLNRFHHEPLPKPQPKAAHSR